MATRSCTHILIAHSIIFKKKALTLTRRCYTCTSTIGFFWPSERGKSKSTPLISSPTIRYGFLKPLRPSISSRRGYNISYDVPNNTEKEISKTSLTYTLSFKSFFVYKNNLLIKNFLLIILF